MKKWLTWVHLKPYILLAALTLVIYLPSFGNQMFWDDEQFIYKNHYVLTFNVAKILTENMIAGAGENSNYFRPLTSLSFATDHAIWGLNPFGFHLTNTVLHIISGLAIYCLIKELKLFGSDHASGIDWPWWLAIIYLLHPIQTEAVTYINSRGDSMYAAWLFSSVWLYARLLHYSSRDPWKEVPLMGRAIPQWLLWLFIPTGYALSILSKETALAGFGLFFLATIQVWLAAKSPSKESPHRWVTGGVMLSLAALATGYLGLRATALNFANTFNFYNGDGGIYETNLGVRLLTFGHILWEYLRLLLIPFPLHMERNPPIYSSLWDWAWPAVGGLVVGLATLGYLEWRRFKTVAIWLGTAWWFGMLLPVSGIIPINGLMYEHWLYVPMIGYWLVLLRGLSLWRNTHQALAWITPCLRLLLIIFGSLTVYQNWLWHNPIRFYSYTLKFHQTARIYNNLAMAYADQGSNTTAIEMYHKALAIEPRYPQIHYNLGNTYLKLQEFEVGEASLLKAIELSPNFPAPYVSLIQLYQFQNQPTKLVHLITKLQSYYPDDASLDNLLLQAQTNAATTSATKTLK